MSNIEKKVEELKTMLDNNEDFILLDVRTENEVLVSKISNKSIHIPMNEIPNRLTELNSNKEIIELLRASLEESSPIQSKKIALEYIGLLNKLPIGIDI